MIESERLDYPLDASSLVWDVGAYRGEFSRAAGEKWRCRVTAFEPITDYHVHTQGRPPHVTWFPFGLGDKDETIPMALAGDRTSAYKEAAMHVEYRPGPVVPIQLRDVATYVRDNLIAQVDLAKINIEGGEYPLLRRLIDSGYITRFRYLQVQFHTFIPEFGEKYLALKKDLLRTHDLSWRWPWKWESWARR